MRLTSSAFGQQKAPEATSQLERQEGALCVQIGQAWHNKNRQLIILLSPASTVPRVITTSPTQPKKIKNRNRLQNTSGSLEPSHNALRVKHDNAARCLFCEVFCRTFVLHSFVAACDCFAFVEGTKTCGRNLACFVVLCLVRLCFFFVCSMWHVLVFIVAVPRYPLAFQAMVSRGRGLGLDLGTILPARNGHPVETYLGQRHEVQNIR